jgi:transcriptional regulator with XRE-family HTH domain
MRYHRLNGAALAARREAKGFSQRELARRCGISAPYLCQIENGLKQPSPPVMIRLVAELGILLADVAEPVEAAS